LLFDVLADDARRGAPPPDAAKWDGDRGWPCMMCRFTRPVNSDRSRRAWPAAV